MLARKITAGGFSQTDTQTLVALNSTSSIQFWFFVLQRPSLSNFPSSQKQLYPLYITSFTSIGLMMLPNQYPAGTVFGVVLRKYGPSRAIGVISTGGWDSSMQGWPFRSFCRQHSVTLEKAAPLWAQPANATRSTLHMVVVMRLRWLCGGA